MPESVYANDTFPDYLQGSGYFISRAAVLQVLQNAAADSPWSAAFPIEDVFITGLLRSPDTRLLGFPGSMICSHGCASPSNESVVVHYVEPGRFHDICQQLKCADQCALLPLMLNSTCV